MEEFEFGSLHEVYAHGDVEAILQDIIVLDRNSAAPEGLAGSLLRKFGDLHGVLHSSPEELGLDIATSKRLCAHFRKILHLAAALVRQEVSGRNVLDSTRLIVDFCRLRLTDPRREQLLGIYLDSDYRLMGERLLQSGTVNHVTVYPREILRHALLMHAAHVVIVHNHPGGDPHPGRRDIEITNELASIADKIGIGLADHIILGDGSYFSFRQNGKLGRCAAGRDRSPLAAGTQIMRVGGRK